MDDSENREQPRGTIKVSGQIVNLKLRFTPHAWHPATDLFETSEEYLVKIEIAGMSEEGFTVCMEDNTLMVSGERPLVKSRWRFPPAGNPLWRIQYHGGYPY